jgi:hypothetical protein
MLKAKGKLTSPRCGNSANHPGVEDRVDESAPKVITSLQYGTESIGNHQTETVGGSANPLPNKYDKFKGSHGIKAGICSRCGKHSIIIIQGVCDLCWRYPLKK